MMLRTCKTVKSVVAFRAQRKESLGLTDLVDIAHTRVNLLVECNALVLANNSHNAQDTPYLCFLPEHLLVNYDTGIYELL